MIVNIDKVINVILLIVILFLSLCSKPSVTVNEGISEEEYLYRLEVFKIGVENEKLRDEIQNFKEAMVEDSVFIHHATESELDSMFTEYFTK